MMCNTGFKFRIKDMLFEPLENISITLFLLFHPLGYSIHLKNILEWIKDYRFSKVKYTRKYLVKIVIQKDDGMIILSSVEFENTNNFVPS